MKNEHISLKHSILLFSPEHPCKECKCGGPTESCSEMMCSPIWCPAGMRVAVKDPDVCCSQECVPIEAGTCVDFKGKVVEAGKLRKNFHSGRQNVTQRILLWKCDGTNLTFDNGTVLQKWKRCIYMGLLYKLAINFVCILAQKYFVQGNDLTLEYSFYKCNMPQ